jgi:hypothetical protein
LGSAAGLFVAAQVQLSAKLQQLGTGSAAAALAGDAWELSAALRALSLPHTHSSWRLLAAALYRAVLQQLPASARLWFSDLRDRARLAAVETYTTRFESPALLAAEFAAIRRDAGGASGEVGGSCSFRVRASPAAREVTAVLEIEDGATLELQVKLPAAAPLKAAEVECRNKVSWHLNWCSERFVRLSVHLDACRGVQSKSVGHAVHFDFFSLHCFNTPHAQY